MSGTGGEAQRGGPPGTGLRWAGAVGIATVAVFRAVTVFAPRVVFDVDPALDPAPLAGLGPPGSLFLDAVLLAACGAALLGEHRAGRRLDWRLLLAALLPAPVIVAHGAGDAGDLWRGTTWLAAAAACATVAQLARDRTLRAVLAALLLAALVPVALRGALQSAVELPGVAIRGPEYAETVAEFEANREAYFADRGWAPDSAAARLYEHRLRRPDPRGWFPSTNLFASLMACGLVVLAGLAGAAVGRRRGPALLLIAGAGAAAAALALSRSKGALLAGLAGLLLLAAPLAGAGVRPALRRFGGAAAVALLVAALGAVALRGALPEGWAGERSLLYRWHYLVGAARIVADQPLAGVGPGGFQAAYTAVRVPRSPEEVASAHSVFADWLAALGVSAAGWIALVGILVYRCGRRLAGDGEERERPRPPPILPAAVAVAVLGLLPPVVIEIATLNGLMEQAARGLGVVAFVAVAAGLGVELAAARPGAAGRALAAGAIALAVHGQIEMTFTDPGSAVWVMAVVGLAGGAPPPSRPRRWGVVFPAVLIAGALVLAAGPARAAWHAQRAMIQAGALLYPPSADPDVRAGRREQAADVLLAAHDRYPAWSAPLEAAARQLLLAAALAGGDRALIDRAVELAERAAEGDRPEAVALAADAQRLSAAWTGDTRSLEAAIAHARRLTEIDPHGIGPWVRLGDLLWDAGRRAEAAEAYRRALRNSDNFELDPLRQLSQRDRQRLLDRLEADG